MARCRWERGNGSGSTGSSIFWRKSCVSSALFSWAERSVSLLGASFTGSIPLRVQCGEVVRLLRYPKVVRYWPAIVRPLADLSYVCHRGSVIHRALLCWAQLVASPRVELLHR